MNSTELEATLAAGYPVDRERIAKLDIEAMEADLFADVETLPAHPGAPPGRRRRGRRPLALGLAGAAVAAAVAVLLVLGDNGAERPSPAYGAELVRFAESTPLLLLEGPEWGVRNVDQLNGAEGRMEFTRRSPNPHPMEPLMTRADVKRHITPPAVMHRRWRRVELNWFDAGKTKLLWHDGKVGRTVYSEYLGKTVDLYEHGPAFKTTITALGVTAYVAPRTETAPIQGGPGDRAMAALWIEGHHLIEVRASVPSLAAFRQRLDWLRRVDAQTWLDAMPAKVVKGAEYGATVQEILAGIPQPPGFDPSTIPVLGLTTARYQVGAAVGGAVACGWFSRWGEARAEGDAAAASEAERILLESETSWPIFKEMSEEGAYPATVIEYAKAMRSGRWYGRPLLKAVFAKGGLCSRGGTRTREPTKG
jgi:hypothetical protein